MLDVIVNVIIARKSFNAVCDSKPILAESRFLLRKHAMKKSLSASGLALISSP